LSISTHILDTSIGRPAEDVPVSLAFWKSSDWIKLNGTVTDADGRIKHLLPDGSPFEVGLYRARFDTAAYYEARGVQGLYPYVDIVFEVTPGQPHYHIPLLLTPNSYTTYRGS
jgi:5-hydroxyisourate hydrolase